MARRARASLDRLEIAQSLRQAPVGAGWRRLAPVGAGWRRLAPKESGERVSEPVVARSEARDPRRRSEAPIGPYPVGQGITPQSGSYGLPQRPWFAHGVLPQTCTWARRHDGTHRWRGRAALIREEDVLMKLLRAIPVRVVVC